MVTIDRPKKLSVAEVRSRLAEICNRVAYGGEDIVITKHGKPTGVIISPEDYEFLKEMYVRRTLQKIKEQGLDSLKDISEGI